MVPLGVLTAIVGAIRVSGADWLKRLVGRARENIADAEIEMMSSVSQEVCEVCNGTSIVRSKGCPQVKQIIHLPAQKGIISPESFITMNPETWSDRYKLKDGDSSAKDTGSSANLPEVPLEESTVVRISKDADSDKTDNSRDPESLPPKHTVRPPKYQDVPPNISLNIHGGSDQVELVMCTFMATILQAAVLGWSGLLAYSSYASRHKVMESKSTPGFWLQCTGTVLLTLSLVLCAGIIDDGSY